MNAHVLRPLQMQLEQELTKNILPYWMEHALDDRLGGFVGLVLEGNVRRDDAPKGAILNARILWTFSAAYRTFGDPAYRNIAERAATYFRAHFVDPVHGGVYWMLDATAKPCDERKHIYAQSFAIYALSEHYRATGHEPSLESACHIFRLIEHHAFDTVQRGYHEAFSREWVALSDVRLSEEDANEHKSMNTHLHVLEAYTALYRAWPDGLLKERLRGLIEVFLDHIIDPETAHVRSFFDDDWTPKSAVISYGHDIEASWLLLEAATAVADDELRARVRSVCIDIADAVRVEALDPAGGIFYRACPGGEVETYKEWWAQAEAIVGFVNAFQETERREFLDAAVASWAFTKRHIVDRAHGEWHRRVERDGTLLPHHEKVGPWKCPYHNARACLEVMARVNEAVAIVQQ